MHKRKLTGGGAVLTNTITDDLWPYRVICLHVRNGKDDSLSHLYTLPSTQAHGTVYPLNANLRGWICDSGGCRVMAGVQSRLRSVRGRAARHRARTVQISHTFSRRLITITMCFEWLSFSIEQEKMLASNTISPVTLCFSLQSALLVKIPRRLWRGVRKQRVAKQTDC